MLKKKKVETQISDLGVGVKDHYQLLSAEVPGPWR